MNYNNCITLNSYDPSIYLNNDTCFNNNILCIPAFYDDLVYDHSKNPGYILTGKNGLKTVKVPIPDFLSIKISINNMPLDVSTCRILSYKEKLHMQTGIVEKEILLNDKNNRKTSLCIKKVLSFKYPNIHATYFKLKPINYNATITSRPYISFADISSKFTNLKGNICNKYGLISATHNDSGFNICAAMKCELHEGYFKQTSYAGMNYFKNSVYYTLKGKADNNTPITIIKYTSILCRNIPEDKLSKKCKTIVKNASTTGFNDIFLSNS